jgi:hypothetical protein
MGIIIPVSVLSVVLFSFSVIIHEGRGGFPFLTNISDYELAERSLPNTPNEAMGQSIFWEDDNCIHMNTRDCLAKFFHGSTSQDIAIINLGMPYTVIHPLIDTFAWIKSSASAFRSHLTETFPGKVFRTSNAQMLKHVAHSTPLLQEIDHKALWPMWMPGSEKEDRMWYTIDQWAINEGRNHLYNDHVHYNGPLTHAMLHQVLNIVCPNMGLSREFMKTLSTKIIQVNKSHKLNQPQGTGEETKVTETLRKKHEPVTSVGEEEQLEYYVYDQSSHIHQVASACLEFLIIKDKIQLSETDISLVEKGSDFPAFLCNKKEKALIRPGSSRIVYLIENLAKHAFTSGQVFSSHGYSFENVQVIEDWAADLIPTGDDVV